MKRTALSWAFLCLCCFASAQLLPEPVIRCYTAESLQDFRQKNPGAQTDAQFEKWLNQKIVQQAALSTGTSLTIPVIFHIIHNGEAVGSGSNLSAAQIQQQLNQLNADFANLSGSRYAVAANMDVSFCLAVVAPDGTPLAEPGIQRINRNAKGWLAPPYDGMASNSYVDAVVMPGSIWDPYRYFNIWTLDLTNGLLGKATFPVASGLAGLGSGETDTHAGVFIHYKSVGSVSSPGAGGTSYGLGRTLTHEAGHFFGLRHIWGDSNCGNDYCDDTPPQFTNSTGCPAPGSLNNCTPSMPKMFENYMDYSRDACVNTFTADQKTRLQAVMANSPRRKELASAGTCAPEAANAIRFGTPVSSVSETALVTTCPQYREVVVPLNIYDAASADATVTFNTSGTATNNKDYAIIPSSVSYTAGDNTPKAVTIRIWDDAEVESTETIELSYTITGAGVVPGSANQTFTVTVTDNDKATVVNNNGQVVLLNENFGAAGGNLPAGWVAGSFLDPAGINEWVVSSNAGSDLDGQAAHITNDLLAKPNAYSDASTSDAVLVTKAIDATGLSNLSLQFRYKCNGEADAGGVYDFGTLMYSFDGWSFDVLADETDNPYIFQGTTVAQDVSIPLPASFNNQRFYLGFRWLNDASVGNNPAFAVDDVVVAANTTQIESEAGQSATAQVFRAQEVYLKSTPDGQLIAKIDNASADIGCLTASVTQTGTAAVRITTAGGEFVRTGKVVQLSPAVADSLITYAATLYFTLAEFGALNEDKSSVKLLKVKDGVDLSVPISGGDAVLVTPTSVRVDSAGGYIAFTGAFTGFSQFMLVAEASANKLLPVTWLRFDARPVQSSIRLTWQTAGEQGNKGFFIERSTDGKQFATIGWVAGRGNAAAAYSFTDDKVQPAIRYYYRLRQVDADGTQSLSEVRSALLQNSNPIFAVYPNPASGFLTLTGTGLTGKADITLFNTQGQAVRHWKGVSLQTAATLQVTGLASGVYSLMVNTASGRWVQKVVVH